MHACKDHLYSFTKHIIVAVSKGYPNCLRNIQSCIASVVIAHVSTCKRAPTLSLQYAWLCPWLDILWRCTREDMLRYVSKSTPPAVTARSPLQVNYIFYKSTRQLIFKAGRRRRTRYTQAKLINVCVITFIIAEFLRYETRRSQS